MGTRCRLVFALGMLIFGAASMTAASEGGLGRPLTGMQVIPFAGVIPPDPGFVWQVGYIYYGGDARATNGVPIGGELALDLDAELSLFTATGTYIWNTKGKRWNYASMLTVPYIMVDIQAEAVLEPFERSLSDDASDLFDLFFAPIIASYHRSQVEHWSFALYVYAPTADYEVGRLANPGLNNWTVIPSVGYTRLFSEGTLELSALAGVEIYSKNEDTDYQNGEIFRLDALLMKRLANGWGFGLAGGWIHQLTDDEGGLLTELTGGFKGRALGLGPAVSYSHKTEAENQIDFNLRWVPEIDTKNRLEGNAVQFTVAFNF